MPPEEPGARAQPRAADTSARRPSEAWPALRALRGRRGCETGGFGPGVATPWRGPCPRGQTDTRPLPELPLVTPPAGAAGPGPPRKQGETTRGGCVAALRSRMEEAPAPGAGHTRARCVATSPRRGRGVRGRGGDSPPSRGPRELDAPRGGRGGGPAAAMGSCGLSATGRRAGRPCGQHQPGLGPPTDSADPGQRASSRPGVPRWGRFGARRGDPSCWESPPAWRPHRERSLVSRRFRSQRGLRAPAAWHSLGLEGEEAACAASRPRPVPQDQLPWCQADTGPRNGGLRLLWSAGQAGAGERGLAPVREDESPDGQHPQRSRRR